MSNFRNFIEEKLSERWWRILKKSDSSESISFIDFLEQQTDYPSDILEYDNNTIKLFEDFEEYLQQKYKLEIK